jgi:hypothetical protein
MNERGCHLASKLWEGMWFDLRVCFGAGASSYGHVSETLVLEWSQDDSNLSLRRQRLKVFRILLVLFAGSGSSHSGEGVDARRTVDSSSHVIAASCRCSFALAFTFRIYCSNDEDLQVKPRLSARSAIS